MKTSIREENSQNQNVRGTLWGEKKRLPPQELEWLSGQSSTGGKSDRGLGPGQRLQAPAWTQRQPGETETVLCVESDFWDKRNRMKNAECLVAAVRHEKREE